MPWFKVDDALTHSRKVLQIPKRRRLAAMGLWTLAGSWCARELTDGLLPKYALEDFPVSQQAVHDLISVGLWHDLDALPTCAHCSADVCPTFARGLAEGSLLFHDWARYQPSKAEVVEERKANAARQKAWRRKKKEERNAVTDAVTDNVSNTASNETPARPDPARPDPVLLTEVHKPKQTHRVRGSQTLIECDGDAMFDDFWDAYPRPAAKLQAIKVWDRQVKKFDPADIVAGARRYRDDPNRPTDLVYVPEPPRWLNEGRWADGPCVIRNDDHRKNGQEKIADLIAEIQAEESPGQGVFDVIDGTVG